MFRVATFNANSVRARLPIITTWLEINSPDLLAIQETKCQDHDFPASDFTSAGYHVVFKGEKSYNGVALVSRLQPSAVSFGLPDSPHDEPRLIRARVGPIDVVNTYVPQGRAVDDPNFAYKLQWFARLRRLFETNYSPDAPLLWLGDLNVAPEPRDVYDPARLDGSVDFHPDERAALAGVLDWGLADVFRKHCDSDGEFTFWDYRIPNAVKRNLGWRLDHLLATAPLAAKSAASWIDRAPRLLTKPSDHTFLVADFDLDT